MQRTRLTQLVVVFARLIFLLLAVRGLDANAVGFRIVNQDANAIARGNAFTATADSPAAIYYNPAGITQLEGRQIQVGAYNISAVSHYTSPSGQEFESNDAIQGAPQVYYTWSPDESRFSFGLGVYVPFGLGIEWEDNTGFRTLGLEASMLYLSINPVVSVEIVDGLSIGAGVSVDYVRAEIRRGIVLPGDSFKFKGDSTSVGFDAVSFNAGILWKINSYVSLGVMYHTGVTQHLEGDAQAKPYSKPEHAEIDLDFPQYGVAGVSIRPTANSNIEFDVDWTDWETLDSTAINLTSGSVPFSFNYKSSFLYKIGATRVFGAAWGVSTGYTYSENSVRSENFSPLVPDTNLHIFNIGTFYKGKHWGGALTYQYSVGPERHIEGSVSDSLAGESADGGYQFKTHAVALSVSHRF